jgi:DNA-binding MarR family transcriptional regulator
MKLEDAIKQPRFRNEYHKLVVNLMYTYGWLNALQLARFKPYGISPQQYNILRILRGQYPNPATINLLIDRMLDKNSNASRLVEKLRVKKLVERTTCPDDRRAVNVLITKKGLELLKELDENEKELRKDFSALSEKEAKVVNDLLDKLRG